VWSAGRPRLRWRASTKRTATGECRGFAPLNARAAAMACDARKGFAAVVPRIPEIEILDNERAAG
jgi:hypothetical protein